MSNILVYSLEGKIYINLTNRCTNDCIFCLRKDKDDVCGQELWLDSEDFGVNDVVEQLNKFELSKEVVFCGYGEPLLKFEILKQVAKYIKENYSPDEIEIELIGLCTDICVVSNALLLKASFLETRVSVDASCCAGVTPDSHNAALTTMKMCQVNVIGE